MGTGSRKDDHLRLIFEENVNAHGTTGFERFRLIHRALPELSLQEISSKTPWFDHMLDLPVMISCMTGGGGERTRKLNQRLARASQKYGLCMGVGSQRALVESDFSSNILKTFEIARTENPQGWIGANIGGQQLVSMNLDQTIRLIDSIKANGIFVHLNPLQELIQPEGDRDFSGIVNAIKELSTLSIPVFIKETGCGFSEADFEMIAKILPFAHVEIGGFGGTHWGWLESLRAPKNENITQELGKRFRDWGNPTAQSLQDSRKFLNGSQKVISSGGIRTGQDVLKSLVLGANIAGIATPFARAAEKSEELLWEEIEILSQEIRLSMLLLGARTVADLNKTMITVHTPNSHQGSSSH